MSSFLPSFSTQQSDKLSEKPSRGTPGALQGCSTESDLPAPASEKRPKTEGRTAASPYYCEWILSGGWLGKEFGDSCRDVFLMMTKFLGTKDQHREMWSPGTR